MKSNNIKNQPMIHCPLVAVDTLIFTIREGKLSVLLIEIGQGPYKNKWALPGGLVDIKETLDEAAEKILLEKAGVRGIYLEQLYSFGDLNRDKRGRSISVAYYALVDSDKFNPKTTEYYSSISWWPVDRLPVLAFDHREIIKVGVDRLRSKVEYSNVAYALLPREFTLTEVQKVYEIILGQPLDKRNFRKKMKSVDIIEASKKVKYGMRNRPAELYRFKKRDLIIVK